MEPVCKVYKCRYNSSHNTSMHLCGTCKEFGHGQLECGKQYYINKLKDDIDYTKQLNSIIWCTMNGCSNKETHTTESHHCRFCKMNHSDTTCINNPNNKQLIVQFVEQIMIYIIIQI
jgi:hypothetical protein